MRQIDLEITQAALAEIEHIFLSSGLDPACHTAALLRSYMVEGSREYSRPEAIGSLQDELRAFSEKVAREDPSKLPYEWVVGIYENRQLDTQDIVRVAGIELAISPDTLPEIDGCALDFRGRWVLTRR